MPSCLTRSLIADGPYAYYSRYETDNEHPIVSRIARDDVETWTAEGAAPASYREVLDANKLAEGREFFKLGGVEHSPDHKIIAYATDVKVRSRLKFIKKKMGESILTFTQLL